MSVFQSGRPAACACYVILFVLGLCRPARAEKPDAAIMATTVAPYVDNETILVAHAGIARVSLSPLKAFLTKLTPDADELAPHFQEADDILTALRRDQVTDVFAVVSLGGQSMIPRMTLVACTTDTSLTEGAVRSMLHLPGNVAVVVKQTASSAGLVSRPELSAALAAAGDAPIQIAIIPPASSRRVIEELVPQLPQVVGGGPGTIITHGVSWAAVGIDLSPSLAIRLTIKSQDRLSAEAFKSKWLAGMKSLSQEKSFQQMIPQLQDLALLLTPKLLDDQLTVSLNEKDPAVHAMEPQISAAIGRYQDAGKRMRSLNNLHSFGLAMHNYYSDAKGHHFPPPAICSPDGKPLLSWRVAILPNLGESALFKQFHLDEPWDSPHNKPLIKKMPPNFRSPKSKGEPGFSNYVVPVGGGALYSSIKDEPQFKDITDGLSHTIMMVEVDDKHAVVWTKPDDLQFDPKDPSRGIGNLYDDLIFIGVCDGSAIGISKTMDPLKLKALFTRAASDPFYGF